MKTTASIDAARLELLLTELRLPAVKLMWKKLAARRHAVMGAQFLVAPRQVVLASRSRLRNAADRLSLRCCSGTPPSAHNAFCRPSASATKLSPPSTTWACAKPEKANRK